MSQRVHWLWVTSVVLAGLLPCIARADVLNFDDVSTLPKGWTVLPVVYHGFSFVQPTQWGEVGDNSWYKSTYSNSYNAPSLQNALWNDSGAGSVTLADGLFNFVGAYVSSFAQRNAYQGFSSRTLTISGYRSGNLVGTVFTALSPNRYDWLAANLNAVDKLVLTGSGPDTWWLMDNFTYQPVPLPGIASGIAVLLCGLATLRVVRHVLDGKAER